MELKIEKLIKEGVTCEDCGRAIVHEDTIFCGKWHSTFSKISLCDKFETDEEVYRKNKERYEKLKKSLYPHPKRPC